MGKAKRLKQQRRSAPPPVGERRLSSGRIRLYVAAFVVVAAGIAVGAVLATRSSTSSAQTPTVDETALAGLQTGPAPWGADTGQLAQRLQTLGLPALTQEGTVLHTHQHLDLYVDGKKVAVPPGIGIAGNQFIAPIHTHDATGIIHVESPTKGVFTLGQFMAIWGVRLTPSCVGGYCGEPISLYVDGKRQGGTPGRHVLAERETLALVVGKAPANVPSSYAFAAGD